VVHERTRQAFILAFAPQSGLPNCVCALPSLGRILPLHSSLGHGRDGRAPGAGRNRSREPKSLVTEFLRHIRRQRRPTSTQQTCQGRRRRRQGAAATRPPWWLHRAVRFVIYLQQQILHILFRKFYLLTVYANSNQAIAQVSDLKPPKRRKTLRKTSN
jgi:hypothetical protein